MLQNIFCHRPPLENPSNKAEITEVPAGCVCAICRTSKDNISTCIFQSKVLGLVSAWRTYTDGASQKIFRLIEVLKWISSNSPQKNTKDLFEM